MSKVVPFCCNNESKWVENVSGKGYHFCESCRTEVMTPLVLEESNKDEDEKSSYDIYFGWPQ